MARYELTDAEWKIIEPLLPDKPRGVLKNYRAIATRFDRHDDNFSASIKLAAIRIWMRSNESVA